jgi:hypothetical protein
MISNSRQKSRQVLLSLKIGLLIGLLVEHLRVGEMHFHTHP